MRFFAVRMLWMLLPLWAAVAVAWYVIERKAAGQLSRFASEPLLKVILRGCDPREIAARRRTRFILALATALCAIIALARPQMGVREESIPSQGLDLVFLLDVSNSMLTEDVIPSRLKKAKHIIRNFVDRLAGDRAGVVAFAGSAYPAVPLTTDYDFLRQTLDVLDENSIVNQGTDLASALEVARDLVLRGGATDDFDPAHESANDDQSSRVIIVVSDGESHEGEETRVVPSLVDKGIKVYTIGVGTTKGGPIPLRDQNGNQKGYKKDRQGNIILTKLESANLEAIASKTGGKYYPASGNEGEVEEIFGQMSTLDRAAGAGRRVIIYDEMFQYPLAFGMLLLFVMIFLREAKSRRVESEHDGVDEKPIAPLAVGFLVLWAVSAGGASQARAETLNEYSETRKGIEAYNDKDYPTAVQEFGKAQASNPDAASHHMNLGDALLRSGSGDAAVNEFQAILKNKNATEAAKGAYNLGKTYEQGKDLEKAIRAYQSGLGRLIEDPKADNLEVETRIKRALEVAQEKKKKQQQSGGGGGGGQGQDQKKGQQDSGQQQQKPQDGGDKKYEIGKHKAQFKDEKLNESDAKRVMQQMQEQEKKSQERVIRAKSGKPKDDKPAKDW